MKEKVQKKSLLSSEATIRRLAISAAFMIAWLLIWALVLKLGSQVLLIRNYNNMKDMTFIERIKWDLIPFNYRGTDHQKRQLFIDSVLNCFVFAPLALTFCYAFQKRNVWRDLGICLGFSVFVEMLQLFSMLGNPAPEDLITNVTGYFIGLGLYHLCFKHIPKKATAILFIVFNSIFAIATVFSIVTTVRALPLIIKIVTRTL